MNNLPLDRNIRFHAMSCIAANLMLPFVVSIPLMIAPSSFGVQIVIPCIVLGCVYPIVIWQTNRRKHSFVEECTRGALNFTLSTYLYLVIFSSIWVGSFFDAFKTPQGFFTNMFIFTSLAIPLICIAYIGGIVFGIVNAAKGNIYKYPFSIRFFR